MLLFLRGSPAVRAAAPKRPEKNIQDDLSAYCFGDFYTRKFLPIHERELLAVHSILASQGGCEGQVKAHVGGNATVGNGKEVLLAALMGVPAINHRLSAHAQRAFLHQRGPSGSETVRNFNEWECSRMKTLVTYFSASGQTAKLAKILAGVTGGDLFEIAPETAYTAADLDWMDKKSRSTIEMKDPKSRPPSRARSRIWRSTTRCSWAFHIWWYQAPRIIETFLESYDFGQDRHPLCHLRQQAAWGEDVLRSACPKGQSGPPASA